MRHKILIAGVLVVAIPIALIGAALLYVNLADLSGWRTTVERLVSEALGRELVIAGEFAPNVGLTTRIVATDVSLASPSWSSESAAAVVGRLDVSVKLLPLLAGRIRVPDVAIGEAWVVLETDADGRFNWAFDTGADGPRPSERPEFELGTVALENVSVRYRAPSLSRQLDLELARLDAAEDETGTLTVELDGALNGSPLSLGGRIGPIGAIVSGGAIEHHLQGHLGNVTIITRGSVDDLSALTGADMELEIHGIDATEVTELLGVPSLGSGAFDVTARMSPSGRATAMSLSADLGQMTADVEAEVDSLKTPHLIDALVSASGPDLAAAGTLIGVGNLPAEPFDLSGHVAWEGFPLTIEDASLRVGDNSVDVDGKLGALPRMLETDVRFDGSGPDLAPIGRLAGLDLPAVSYSIRGRIVRHDIGIGLDAIDVRAADSTVTANGTIGDPPTFEGTDLMLRANGPDLSIFSGLAGAPLPAAAFEVRGRLRPVDGGVALEGFTASVGAHRARIEGTVAATEGLVGTDVEVELEGPDLSWPLGLLGVADAPAQSYRAASTARLREGGLILDGLSGQVGDLSVNADGTLGLQRSLVGTDISVRLEGPDASWPAAAVGIGGMPPQPLDVGGRVRVQDDFYDLDSVQASVGGATLAASGRLGPLPNIAGSDLTIEASIPRLADFAGLVPGVTLPSASASASGRISADDSGVSLERSVLVIDDTRITANGVVAGARDLRGSDVTFEVSGPDLAAAGRNVAATGLVTAPALPSDAFTITGRVSVDGSGYRIEGLRGTLAEAVAQMDGRIGRPPHFRGTDVTVTGDGPDASIASAIIGVTVPVAPFRLDGRIARTESGLRFDNLKVQLGAYDLLTEGTLGDPPRFEGTDLELEVRGPSLAVFQRLAGGRKLPDLPFELEGRFDGNPRRFKSERIWARLGESDLEGSFRIDLEGPTPRLDVELGSRRIDLTEILGNGDEERAPPDAATSSNSPVPERGPVFPDDPMTLDALHRMNGHLHWTAEAVDIRYGTLTDIEVDATLDDGLLQIEPIRGVGAHGGRLNGKIELGAGQTDHQLRSTIQLRDAHVDLSSADEDSTEWPTVDLDFELTATGRSRHALASSADGRIALVVGPGPVDASVLDLLSTDLLVQILEVLTPFDDKQPAMLECAVVVINIDDGLAILDPFAVQGNRTTVVGDGKIDLETEKLNLEWVTKPRKGIGISASTITNAYLKLGGTLSNPKIEAKPLEALATTGVAVVTGGLSLLGKGLFDRISAERKVCERALERAEKRLTESQPRP